MGCDLGWGDASWPSLKRRNAQFRFEQRDLPRNHRRCSVESVASLTKGGLNAATKSLAIEYPKKGVRVNAVAPGVMKTPMHAPETHEFLAKLHPVGRMGEIQDIVDAIVFLENAPFVTGEMLHVDGGQSAGH